jgi:hypothetical protein
MFSQPTGLGPVKKEPVFAQPPKGLVGSRTAISGAERKGKVVLWAGLLLVFQAKIVSPIFRRLLILKSALDRMP